MIKTQTSTPSEALRPVLHAVTHICLSQRSLNKSVLAA